MRRGLRLFLGVEVPVLVLAGALGVAFRPDTTPHPERVTTRVAGCEVSGPGAALGSGVGLVNRVAPGATVTGRALIPLRGNASGVTCAVRAQVHDGHAGHHN